MAINLDERYPGRANPKSLSYPQGSFKNRTSPTSKDGTYLEQDWANDQLAFFQSLIKDAGMTANGQVDTVEASQYFDALIQVISNRFPRIYTLAEAKALDSDIGPIMVIGMPHPWYWVQNSYFSGYRSPMSGLFCWGATNQPLAHEIDAIGQVITESDCGGLIARFRESGLVVSSSAWKPGEFKIADLGGGQWKAPDMRDMFIRATGTDVDTANVRAIGSRQEPALQRHRHSFLYKTTKGGLGDPNIGSDGALASEVELSRNIVSPEEHRVLSTAIQSYGHNETRPLNIALSPRIYR